MSAQVGIPGALRFRAKGARNPSTGKLYGADQRSYSCTVWHRWADARYAETRLLPDMPSADRGWIVRPGTESPELARALGLVEVAR